MQSTLIKEAYGWGKEIGRLLISSPFGVNGLVCMTLVNAWDLGPLVLLIE